VLGPSYFTEEALGYIWERGADGLYSHSDLARPIETHLDLDFLCSYREGWPDQEIFGHLCYGVRLKAPGPHQIVLQPHMVSAIGNYDKVQEELARLTDMGWYELYHLLFEADFVRPALTAGCAAPRAPTALKNNATLTARLCPVRSVGHKLKMSKHWG
jgi:hypothetical protein